MKTKALVFIATALIFVSCKKKDNPNPNPPPQDTYINSNAGSSWNYHEINASSGTAKNSDYTITSTSGDTLINSRKYHVYHYSYGGSQYLTISGHDYYQYDSIPTGLGQIFERIYLNDNTAVGAKWSQNISITVPGFPLSVPFTITNNIVEKGITRNVNGNNYTDVIHVSTSISSVSIPTGLTSDVHSYYAKKYGLIENTSVVSLDFMGMKQDVNLNTKLTSAVLK